MLSVYTRHHPDCKNAADKTWRRCSCPKWIWGSLHGKFIRQSARTHRWEDAEELRRQLTEGLPSPGRRPAVKAVVPALLENARHEEPDPERPKKKRITVEAAVEAYLTDASSRGVAAATLTKLTTIFRKQFLAWTRLQGLEYLDEINLDIDQVVTRPMHATTYWLDIGNNAASGQYILGQPLNSRNRRAALRLRTVSELYPEIVDAAAGEDPMPSCSAIEALDRQEPFINQTLASSALAMLARLFRYGKLNHHGAFFNAETGRMSALPIDPQMWTKVRRRNRRLQAAA